jgi:large subunit ribosomal protein L22
MDLGIALRQLRFTNKAATTPVRKLLESAMANAVHNFKLVPDHLFIKAITVDGGPVLKRWRARAFGRAAAIKKRSSHISVVLDERKIGGGTVEAAAVTTEAVATESAEAPQKTVRKSVKKN